VSETVKNRCYFSLLVPASMKAVEYRVWAACLLQTDEIVQIQSARCPCIGGAGGDCTHVAALLLVIHNLYRASDNPILAKSAPPTVHLCMWNVPSPGLSYDFLRPVQFLAFTKDDLNKPDKRRHLAREASWGRGHLSIIIVIINLFAV
jgi:hypothetical protein